MQRDARPLGERELAAVLLGLAGEDPQQRRLAGAVRPGERDAVAALDGERDAVEEDGARELLAEVGGDDDCHGGATVDSARGGGHGVAIRGSYFESCNCDAICPCRRIDGVSGGRSTHGICTGVLTWLIEEGEAAGTDLAGLAGRAGRSATTTTSPARRGRWILYLDERASEEQQEALEAIFTGRLGGDALEHFPWAWKASELAGVRRVAIELDHTRRRQLLRIRDHVTVRIRDRYAGQEAVTCVIPGHDRDGEELVAEELRVDDAPLAFDYSGTCGYGATFAYSGG